MTKRGRPTVQLKPDRLRGLRKESGFTQAELAAHAYRHLGKPQATADTATKNYQKIERTGRTSPAMAKALAEALGTTVAVLQGEAPDEFPDWINRLEQHLSEQLALGANAALQTALDQRGEADGHAVRALAREIAERLEQVQFGPHRDELTHLAELTGWTEAQLMQPVSIHGHWLLRSTAFGGQSSALVFGVGEVLTHIRQAVSDLGSGHASDVRITMRETLPWLHVDVQRPAVYGQPLVIANRGFSFVRCLPTASGLQWVNPTWRDRFWFDFLWTSWAFANSNFFTGFDGQEIPKDVRDLRLLVEKPVEDQEWQTVAVIQGDLDELPDEVLNNSRREGRSHDLATKLIVSGMPETLAPLLREWPHQCWKVHAGHPIQISLDVGFRLAASLNCAPVCGVRYRLRLVEQTASGEQRSVPWLQSSVEAVAERLRQWLEEEPPCSSATAATPQSVSA